MVLQTPYDADEEDAVVEHEAVAEASAHATPAIQKARTFQYRTFLRHNSAF